MRSALRTVIIFFLCTAVAAFHVSAGERELRIGLISEKPVEIIQEYGPLATHLAGRLRSFGISGSKIVVARNLEEMMRKIKRGEVDLVFETVFSTMEMRERAGMLPTLLAWRKGVREYTTVFFVRKESPIKSLADLRGKTIVFEDPKSTSAYAIPRAELLRHGLKVAPAGEGAEKDAVSYVFANDELNQAFFVAKKRAEAGAFNNGDWEKTPEKLRAEMKVIHETRPIIRYIASFHHAVPSELRNAIEHILLQMDKYPEGRDVLKQASGIRKVELLTERDNRSLAYVKELIGLFE